MGGSKTLESNLATAGVYESATCHTFCPLHPARLPPAIDEIYREQTLPEPVYLYVNLTRLPFCRAHLHGLSKRVLPSSAKTALCTILPS